MNASPAITAAVPLILKIVTNRFGLPTGDGRRTDSLSETHVPVGYHGCLRRSNYDYSNQRSGYERADRTEERKRMLVIV